MAPQPEPHGPGLTGREGSHRPATEGPTRPRSPDRRGPQTPREVLPRPPTCPPSRVWPPGGAPARVCDPRTPEVAGAVLRGPRRAHLPRWWGTGIRGRRAGPLHQRWALLPVLVTPSGRSAQLGTDTCCPRGYTTPSRDLRLSSLAGCHHTDPGPVPLPAAGRGCPPNTLARGLASLLETPASSCQARPSAASSGKPVGLHSGPPSPACPHTAFSSTHTRSVGVLQGTDHLAVPPQPSLRVFACGEHKMPPPPTDLPFDVTDDGSPPQPGRPPPSARVEGLPEPSSASQPPARPQAFSSSVVGSDTSFIVGCGSQRWRLLARGPGKPHPPRTGGAARCLDLSQEPPVGPPPTGRPRLPCSGAYTLRPSCCGFSSGRYPAKLWGPGLCTAPSAHVTPDHVEGEAIREPHSAGATSGFMEPLPGPATIGHPTQQGLKRAVTGAGGGTTAEGWEPVAKGQQSSRSPPPTTHPLSRSPDAAPLSPKPHEAGPGIATICGRTNRGLATRWSPAWQRLCPMWIPNGCLSRPSETPRGPAQPRLPLGKVDGVEEGQGTPPPPAVRPIK
ncbi:nascent polypeptide-associated complex subunit alpha, muscle-specific form-like [Trichechus manatus latirostris]|uniref:Nascent polypeptide-associated complex subunit alpha, muscle-specific form-like n=1 Tax=Trichechus manatus latirostris TaxID=127582 RepID=A0A2Y9FZC2_TRIMA|nr:nascent polypeptide-associated complex subunit alpha, muscle-specific form-like [Trichechus manatus latirostris]